MYKVLAATRADMNEGWVWLTAAGFAPRSIIRITNKANRRYVYCECLEMDANFIKEYNQPSRINIDSNENTVVINDWYRKQLGDIATQKSHDLQIVEVNGLWRKFRANTGHPQVVVRLATWLAAISVGLGALSICLAFISICLAFK